MSDETSASNFNAAELFHTAKGMLIRGDIALAIGLVMILVVMILPMPSFLLDILLALSMTMSVLILMTVLFIQKPLEISSFLDHPADHHAAAPVAQSGIDTPDPGPWPRRSWTPPEP